MDVDRMKLIELKVNLKNRAKVSGRQRWRCIRSKTNEREANKSLTVNLLKKSTVKMNFRKHSCINKMNMSITQQ